ncbi:MAG TPA: sugar ABC transporter permease, partial [Candidatus Hydrogenedentes bacterium]|nr:sugar ABC transporter permease [Candidatus Hydrogenedentota bacterium]
MQRAVRRRRKADQPPLALIYGLLLAPAAFLVTFNYIPAFSALYHAFTEWDIGGESTWVGLANFRALTGDPVFH